MADVVFRGHVASDTDTAGRAAVAGITREQFTIILDTSVPRDLTYSSVALAVNNAKRAVGEGPGEGESVVGFDK